MYVDGDPGDVEHGLNVGGVGFDGFFELCVAHGDFAFGEVDEARSVVDGGEVFWDVCLFVVFVLCDFAGFELFFEDVVVFGGWLVRRRVERLRGCS